MKCRKEGCALPRVAGLDFCIKHGASVLLASSPELAPASRPKKKGKRLVANSGSHLAFLKQAFESQTDECILFPFSQNTVNWLGKKRSATRLMCIWANKLPPEDKPMATHTCGNGHRLCVNPRHLKWGNAQSKADDTALHRATGKQDAASLTPEDIEDVRARTHKRRSNELATRRERRGPYGPKRKKEIRGKVPGSLDSYASRIP